MHLGLPAEPKAEQIQQAVINARIYRFSTRERIERVQRLAQFLEERKKLGSVRDTFEAIHKAYYKMAMALHPDRHHGDVTADDQLKSLNVTYEIIEDVYLEAKEYFEKSEDVRRALETEAHAEAVREAEAAGKHPASHNVGWSYAEMHAKARETEPGPQPTTSIKFMAASVPRYIRNKRLFYLGSNTVIGSRLVKSGGSVGLIYDVIMLPEREFKRARLNLGIEASGSPALEMTNLTPAYIPIDTKEIIVPPGEADPASFAKAYFLNAFGLRD